MVILNRHAEDICALSTEELVDLWSIIADVKAAIVSCFQPDHLNYAFLMNIGRHVHLHMIPRYTTDRSFAGTDFHDDESSASKRVPDSVCNQIALALSSRIDSQS
jgi:diadenosine tetraphosphate (Ap4A) HIT family hydrolase